MAYNHTMAGSSRSRDVAAGELVIARTGPPQPGTPDTLEELRLPSQTEEGAARSTRRPPRLGVPSSQPAHLLLRSQLPIGGEGYRGPFPARGGILADRPESVPGITLQQRAVSLLHIPAAPLNSAI